MATDLSQNADVPSGGNWWSKVTDLVGAGVEAFKADKAADGQQAQATASALNSQATILSSRNLTIAGVAIAAALVLWLVVRKR